MPNWCMNSVSITGPVEKIKALADAIEVDKLLNHLVPMDQTDPEWYHKNINAWGTKWEVSDVQFDISEDGKEITMSFDTAWSPPIQAFRTWSEKNTDCTFKLKYFEPGIGFAGVVDWDGEYFDEDELTQDNDPIEYKEFLLDEFGWEEDEDEEDED